MKTLRFTALILLALFLVALIKVPSQSYGGPGSTVLGVWYPAGSSEQVNVAPGNEFTISINVTNVVDLWAFHIVFYYPTSVLDGVSANATIPGTFCALFTCEEEAPVITEGLGKVEVTAYFNGATRPSGNGILLFITLRVVADGVGALNIDETVQSGDPNDLLGPPDLTPIPHSTRDGAFNNTSFLPPVADFTFRSANNESAAQGKIVQGDTVEFNASASYAQGGANITLYRWNFGDPSNDNQVTTTNPVATHMFRAAFTPGLGASPLYGNFTVSLAVDDDNLLTSPSTSQVVVVLPLAIHDVEVRGVTMDPPVEAIVGSTVKITVVISNVGAFNETFPVTVFVESTPVREPEDITLLVAGSKTLVYEWDTTGLEPTVYQIKARAGILVNETDTKDNQFITFERLVSATHSALPLYLGGALLAIIIIGVAYSLIRRRRPRET